MSADPVDKLREFSAKDCAGKFAVASASPAVIRGYDVALGRQIQGRDATNRTSYVIAPDGKIVYVHSDLSPADHVRNTLAAVQRWRAARKR
jgi:peroxiredoxin